MKKNAFKMSKSNLTIITVFFLFFLFLKVGTANEILMGTKDDSPRWYCGWLELNNPTDFSQSDKLELIIGGTAEKIKIRLLPKGSDPNTQTGILPKIYDVPKNNRVVLIQLESNRPNIVQISVHGGPNPWGKYPLGGSNGPATLEQVIVKRKNAK